MEILPPEQGLFFQTIPLDPIVGLFFWWKMFSMQPAVAVAGNCTKNCLGTNILYNIYTSM